MSCHKDINICLEMAGLGVEEDSQSQVRVFSELREVTRKLTDDAEKGQRCGTSLMHGFKSAGKFAKKEEATGNTDDTDPIFGS